MFERRTSPLPPPEAFLRRLALNGLLAGALIFGSLALGVLGYRCFGGLEWIDALLNASMILTGMGPVDPMRTTGGKLFASFYALFSGVAFLSIVGVMFAPVYHRFLHRFHLELADGTDEGDEKGQEKR